MTTFFRFFNFTMFRKNVVISLKFILRLLLLRPFDNKLLNKWGLKQVEWEIKEEGRKEIMEGSEEGRKERKEERKERKEEKWLEGTDTYLTIIILYLLNPIFKSFVRTNPISLWDSWSTITGKPRNCVSSRSCSEMTRRLIHILLILRH